MSEPEETDDGRFDHTAIEPKWQQAWDDQEVFRIEDDAEDPEYVLAMFPYPSGEMHMGHVRNYAITDAYARFKRMQGESVLHPMGWDSFGLPAENAANERDVDPRGWTMDCIANMKDQMELMGLGFDWDREVTTCEPEYFQWNQWFFQQFYEEDIVERQTAELNWCPDCETVLADENVKGDNEECWRCDTPIERRDMDQWFFTTTDYAEELYDSLDEMDGWPDNVREMQRNWIGKQEGASVSFDVTTGDSVDIFTTRLDTIYGATFFALSPGHEVAQQIAETNDDVADYIRRVEAADDEEVDETSGVFTGEYARNPATGEEIPVYVADYVLEDIGTGALYAVPAHDDRDHAFAREHDIPIEQVVEPAEDAAADPTDIDVEEQAYTEDGVLVNSGEYDGLSSEEARERFVEVFDGEFRTAHSLRDWCISRQRYWGTPIPFVECPDCGYVPVPEENLPVELPEFVQTTGNPLDAAEEWKQTTCPDCGGPAERETDTMDTFVDSSWYFLRYVSPDLDDAPFDTGQGSDWLPVDQYVGGIEHATMHLIYSRFFTKVLDDLDMLNGLREPFENLLTQGMVRKEGAAMSSSSGNVVSPRPFVENYGADTGRLFMLDAAQPEKDFDWTAEGAQSAHDFLQNVYGLTADFAAGDIETGEGGTVEDYLDRKIRATAAMATAEFERFRFNHALQAVRDLVSLLRRYVDTTEPSEDILDDGLSTVTRLLAPVAPHIAEELWELLGGDGLVAEADWPDADKPDGYGVERRLVENTREDIRDIIDVADIADPARIEIAVAPAWKHRVRELAEQADGDVVGAVMSDDDLRQHGEAAADFAKEFIGQEHFDDQLPPAEETAALDRATWLIEREFDADIAVYGSDDAPEELARKATPGRPAINIEESG
ncbi:leucyl-tRNA synthetase [Halovenus aranensis]|uniref:Leucine--tRNA ligase n=1 Tax=Halovenus aranensis TaxID=890420 RepID=A0A1G8RXY0_9EURY|nr:leucine--tRNA ligase [Halovenus aranensis]SDJ21854.1 leucyl-tRNA synthetase [Halovenus aranensis]